MTFNEAIKKIMPEVQNGSDEPFVIYRDKNSEWRCDFTQNQYGETFNWVEDIKSKDPLAVEFKGSDFARGSFSYVYDKVLVARLFAEYNLLPSDTANLGEFCALAHALEDNMDLLSSEVTDYLSQYDRPLASVQQMLKLSLESIDHSFYYNEDKVQEAFDTLERKIEELINRSAVPIVDYADDNYKEMYHIKINDRELFIGENPNAENRYIVQEWWIKPSGEKETIFTGVTNDYLEAIEKYTKDVQYYISCAISERDVRKSLDGVEPVILTAADCVPGGMDVDLTGKLIIIKPDVLVPEKRTADFQLKRCDGGLGAKPNSRGNAVFCTDLYSGDKQRFERYDVLGVADISRLPEWTKDKLALLQNVQKGKGVLKNALDKARQKVAQVDAKAMEKTAEQGNKPPCPRRDGLE